MSDKVYRELAHHTYLALRKTDRNHVCFPASAPGMAHYVCGLPSCILKDVWDGVSEDGGVHQSRSLLCLIHLPFRLV